MTLKDYSSIRKHFLAQKPMCQAKLENCTLRSTDVHHMKGRGMESYLNTDTWLSVCRSCHNWIENNPEESYELGFSKKRLE